MEYITYLNKHKITIGVWRVDSAMAPKIERVAEGYILGEGPHWDNETQSLYFVDIGGRKIMKYVPSTKKMTKISVAPKRCSFIIPIADKKDQFLVSLDGELAVISWNGENENFSIIETLCSVSNTPETSNSKFNDAKCDPSGRLWVGNQTVGTDILKTLPLGSLYTLDSKRTFKSHVDKIRIANGLAFNDQLKKMYYIDSLKGTVDQFDFDVTSGTITNRQVFFTLSKHNIPGIPDGMTIDTDGNLWVAIFGGSRILKIDGKKPETLLETVTMPALQVTSLAFGGPNLDELYVTTAAVEIEGQKLLPPDHGALYKVIGTGSKGFPNVSFKLD